MKVIVKLGGSLITKKDRPYTPRRKVIKRLSAEIEKAFIQGTRLVVVHGGGSYGHYEANKSIVEHGSLENRDVPRVTFAMSLLNNLVINSLISKNLPAISFPPHSICTNTCKKHVSETFNCDLTRILLSYHKGSIPVVYGDIVYGEKECPPAIISGDDLALKLSLMLQADRIVFAMDVDGIYRDPQIRGSLYKHVSIKDIPRILGEIKISEGPTDVTQGITGKLEKIYIYLKNERTPPRIYLVNGLKRNFLYKAIMGESVRGTIVERL
jgi:isopentenyl phosphate kinase